MSESDIPPEIRLIDKEAEARQQMGAFLGCFIGSFASHAAFAQYMLTHKCPPPPPCACGWCRLKRAVKRQ